MKALTAIQKKRRESEARALALADRRDYALAIPLLIRASASRASSSEVGFSLARSYFHLGDIHKALSTLRRLAQSSSPEVRRAALGRIAVYIPGDAQIGNAQILKARRQWARLETQTERLLSPPVIRARVRPRKLRIGYVSAFFAQRNWMKPVWNLLVAHDRRAFDIYLFIDRGLPIRGHGYAPHPSDRVHFLDNLSNEAAAHLIARLKIDILVDLNAYSYPARLGLFLRKPAPVQVGWFNTYATSGIGAFDYAIGDDVTLPAGEKDFCSEKILRVSGSYLAFSVPYRVPKVVAPPCTHSTVFTFGCLAPQYKITSQVIAAFAAVLREIPDSRIILKNTCLASAGNRAEIRARFLRHGIPGSQLVCEGPSGHFSFLRTYSRIDVALDTFPFSGGTTTMEALWQGVPVLTFTGDRWVSRITASLLRAGGLGEWVLPSSSAFVRRAIALAEDPETGTRLGLLRMTMRGRLRTSPACDGRRLCRQLESHYLAISANAGYSPKGSPRRPERRQP